MAVSKFDEMIGELKKDVGDANCKEVVQELTKILYLEQESTRLTQNSPLGTYNQQF